MAVSEVIEQRREEYGMPIAELARRTGIDYQQLWMSLGGKRGITAGELVAICRVLGLSLEDFGGESDD